MDDGTGKMLRTCHLEMAAVAEPGVEICGRGVAMASAHKHVDQLHRQGIKASLQDGIKTAAVILLRSLGHAINLHSPS